ncbi:MAG TPA: hypothetical protein VMF30_06180 [Pirellulales bacterium]|nr:hypothetical protein [Pirellulales bacterium]
MATDIPRSEEFFRLTLQVGRQLRRHALLVGGTLLVLAAVGWLAAAVAVDLLIPLATGFRLLFAVGFWVVLWAGIPLLVVWPALRRMTLEDVALRIERAVGGMHNRLLTVLDLHRADPNAKRQPNAEMVERLLVQTRAKLAAFHIRQLIDPMPLLRSVAGLAAVLLTTVLLAVVFRESAPTALARILRPTADIPPVTWLRIAVPGDLTCALGDPLPLDVDVTRGEVDALTLHLQQPDGTWVAYPMQRDGASRFSYTLSGVTADYRYKISGGGTWTAEYAIHMVPRPVVDSLTASIRLPRYMRHEEPLAVADDARRIEAPIDSHLVLSTAVSGDVSTGEVLLLRRTVETHEEVQEDEHAWFDDDLPADAVPSGPWRWSTARASTGLKSFAFGRTRQPLAFTTRLNPLNVAAKGDFSVMAWLDPEEPPGRITLRVEQDNNNVRVFEWGEKSTAPPPAGQPTPVHLDAWPEPARWTRLEVPADPLGSAGGPIKLRGMSLAIDRGQAFFDRPGYLTRASRPVETVHTETLDSLPMYHDETSGRWIGDVLVAVDRLLTVRFHSALGQTSIEREPLELIAIKDQPPTLVVEKPAQDVILPAVQPLPIAARALDDWGIAAVGLQLGQSEGALGAVRWLPSDESLVTARNINLAIDCQAEHISPGQTVFYRLVVKDTAGQLAESKPFKLAVAAPDRAGAPETAKGPESLDGLVQMVSQMAQAPHKDREAAELVAGVLPKLHLAVDVQGRFRHDDGSLVEAEELRKLLEQAQSELTPDQKNRLNELMGELDRRQQELRRLAETLQQAAQKSQTNPLASQQDAKLLTTFAAQAQAMATELAPTTVAQGDAARLERELKAQRPAADQTARLAQLEQQLRQLEQARKQFATDPALAEQMMADQAVQVAGFAAARQLDALATDLEARGQQLVAIEEQAAMAAGQTATADAKTLDTISDTQTELDEKAAAAIDSLRDLLGLKSDDDDQPLAPWTPPGEKFESAPVEEDVPDPDKKDKSKSDNAAGPADAADAKADEEENWWDKPAEVPSVGGPRGVESERYKDRHRPVPEMPAEENDGPGGKSAPKPPEATPRQQLTAHQAQLQQALTANADEARRRGAAARALAQRLSQSAASTPTAPDASATRQIMADSATRQALDAAERMKAPPRPNVAAKRARQAMPTPSPQSPTTSSNASGDSAPFAGARPGQIVVGAPPLGTDPSQRARLYQLPPRVREPLLEGMQERGPEGYQPLIDAYFRELSKEIK